MSFPALGTTAIVVAHGDSAAAQAAVRAVQAEITAIDEACSRFRPDSELSRINAARGRPMAASPLLMEAVEVALRAARLTGGLVDPTLGGALKALGYDRDFAALAALGDGRGTLVTLVACRAPGWRVVSCNRETGVLTLPDGVELDLGATAKALAADRSAAAAAAAARCGVLVSLGGDVAVAGPAPGGGWSVRVTDDHASGADAPGQTVAIAGGGLATSGTTVRRWRHGGHEVHHLIDPARGRPTDGPWRTASVAAGSCVDANTASTASIVLGRGAPAWLAAAGLPARLVATGGEATYVGGWPHP